MHTFTIIFRMWRLWCVYFWKHNSPQSYSGWTCNCETNWCLCSQICRINCWRRIRERKRISPFSFNWIWKRKTRRYFINLLHNNNSENLLSFQIISVVDRWFLIIGFYLLLTVFKPLMDQLNSPKLATSFEKKKILIRGLTQ